MDVAFPGGKNAVGGYCRTVKELSECRLYTFVDTAFLRGRRPEDVAQQLCDGGSDLVQLRAKHSSIDEVRRMAQVIFPITSSAGVGLVINDHVSIASEIRADFCHLGQEDFFDSGDSHVSQMEASDGNLNIGMSTHAPEQAERALAVKPAYIAIGPVYATGTKPAAQPVTLEYVRWASVNVNIPWFAIGGITMKNLDDVLTAGAKRVCVVSAILNAPDIANACRQFKQRLQAV